MSLESRNRTGRLSLDSKRERRESSRLRMLNFNYSNVSIGGAPKIMSTQKVLDVSVIGIGSMAQTIHLPMIKSLSSRYRLARIIDPYMADTELREIAGRYECEWSKIPTRPCLILPSS